MGSGSTIGLAAGLLGGVCAVALIFFWWWFPRTWRKGNADEAVIAAANREARIRYMAQHKDLEEGKEDAGDGTVPQRPPPAYHYTPPTYATY